MKGRLEGQSDFSASTFSASTLIRIGFESMIGAIRYINDVRGDARYGEEPSSQSREAGLPLAVKGNTVIDLVMLLMLTDALYGTQIDSDTGEGGLC